MARNKAKQVKESGRLPIAILTLATLACLLPFLGKAFHMDDPLFIWAAQHIRAHPLDAYGFQVNWYGFKSPMWQVTQNPPLACYYIALVSCLVGWSEIGIHVFMMIPAAAVVLGTYQIARKMCSSPLLAALVTLLTPAFLISGTTVMCDVLMLAFWVWAIVFWMRGMDEGRHGHLLISAVLIAAAAMTKYYGAALVPLLLAYSVTKKRSVGWWACYLLIPAGALGLYQLATHAMYGRGLLTSAAAYVTSCPYVLSKHPLQKILTGLTFTGGCLAPVLFLGPVSWSRRALLIGLVLTGGIAAALAHVGMLGQLALRGDSQQVLWSLVMQISVWMVVGLGAMVLTLREAIRRRDPDTLMLGLWVVFTLLFASVVNWSINGRSILPAAPAIGILLVKAIESRHKVIEGALLRKCFALLIPAAVLAIWTSWGDYNLAGAWRASAEDFCSSYSGKVMHAEGHWGFQYYAEKAGAAEIDITDCRMGEGDAYAIPFDNTNLTHLPADRISSAGLTGTPVKGWLATMGVRAGAGFYSEADGPLPFAIGEVPDLRTDAGVVTKPFILRYRIEN